MPRTVRVLSQRWIDDLFARTTRVVISQPNLYYGPDGRRVTVRHHLATVEDMRALEALARGLHIVEGRRGERCACPGDIEFALFDARGEIEIFELYHGHNLYFVGWGDSAPLMDVRAIIEWLDQRGIVALHDTREADLVAPEFVILSRDKAESYEPRGVEICISISDPGVEPAQLSPDFADVLQLSFSDISSPTTAPEDVLFDWNHVEAIERFIAGWRHVDRVVIHGITGVSRAPAVALGICDVRGWPTSALEEAHPSWNKWVRTKLRTCVMQGQ